MRHTKKRLLSIFLIAMMLCSFIPAPAFAMVIQHNISAINSYRNLGINQSALSKNLEKLSSGYKINRAGDDAAGLAISEKMRSEVLKINGQLYWIVAERSELGAVTGTMEQLMDKGYAHEHNLEEPFTIRTGEGAPTEMIYMPIAENRETGEGVMAESILIVQDNTVDGIEPIEDMSNYIGSTSDSGETRYTLSIDVDGGTPISGISAAPGHEINLTDGKFTTSKDGFTFGGLYLDAKFTQPAPNTIEMTSDVTLYVKWTAGTSETVTNADGSTTTITTNADGSTVEIIENTDGTVTAAASISETAGTAMIKNAQTTGELQVDFAVVGDVVETTVNLPQSVSDAVDEQGLQVYVATSIGTTTYKGVGDAAQLNNLKAAGVPTAGDVRSITLTNDNGQPKLTFTDGTGKVIPNVYGGAVMYAAGENLADGALYVQTAEGELADINGLLDLMAETAQVAAGNYTFVQQNGAAQVPDEVMDALSGFLIAVAVQTFDAAKAANNVIGTAGIYDAEQMLDLNIGTQQDAQAAVDVVEGAINQVSAYRAKLGAIQNRLEYNVGNLDVQAGNITATEVAVRDTDMASEIMAYTKNNILIQSAQAMLAQANQVPQGVLSMLQ